jgi:two-component system, chemotaxis family, sensor kinase CheA
MDDQLLREFLAEAEDLIEMLVGDLQTLRARRGEGRARRELTARIFRHVHTIKGTAAAAELEVTSQIAHEFETLLDGVRMGRFAVDDAVLDAFEDSATAISQSLSAVVRGEAQPPPAALLERLRRLALKGEAEVKADAASEALASLPEEIARSLSEYEEHRLHEAAQEGARLLLVTVNFDLATFDERFRDFSDALSEGGELISTLPGLAGAAPDQINFRIVYATEQNFEEIMERVKAFGAVTFAELTAAAAAADEQTGTSADDVEDEALMEEQPPASIAPLTSLVRVELSELDEMVSAAHELLTDTTGALDLSLSCDLTRPQRTEMEIRAARIRRRFVELEERLIGLRMIPVAQTLTRAARAGAIAARSTRKEVDFETRGGEVRLDKSLADAISDPLLHLLRNAVDHGIEPPEERAGRKPARGRVLLEAVADGSRVRVLVTDDGRGIDTARIARAAIERGILDAGANISREQSLRLIFRPGFSTARSVSNMSGRGVGLDVVEHAVEQIGGELRVWSEAGVGTTFEMILPTTLALVPSLIVHSAGYRYCVDASHIVEAGFVRDDDVERLGDASVIRWRGSLLPLVRMRELLAQPFDHVSDEKRAHVLISHVAGQGANEASEQEKLKRVAVAVDGWDGHHEVLVRGLGQHAARWRGVSGAAELRDGTVALVLDLPRLLEMAL